MMVTATNNRQDAEEAASANDLCFHFRAPNRFLLLPEYTDGEHIAFGVLSGDGDGYEEAIDVYHYHASPDEAAPTWHSDIEALATVQGWQELDLRPPVGCRASDYTGELSTFRCLVPGLGKQIAGAIWTATMVGDHVAVCYRCALKREAVLGETMAGILGGLAILRRPSPDLVPSSAPRSVVAPPARPLRPASPRNRRLRSLPWRNIGIAALLLPIFFLVAMLGIRDGKRMAEIEDPVSSTLAPPQVTDGAPTEAPERIGAQYVGDSIVALSKPGINFALPSTVSTTDTSDSPICAHFVGRTARLVVCNQQRGNSIYDDWDSLRRVVVSADAKGSSADMVEAPHAFSTAEGIMGVEGIIRYTAAADGAAIEQWLMIGMTPRDEQFSIYYLTDPSHPLDASPVSPDHLIRDTITVGFGLN